MSERRGNQGAWRNRIVGQGNADPADLVPNPKNWRLHPTVQREIAQSSLGSIGWIQQPIVNKRTGHLIDGHMRVEVALAKGEKSIPVLYVDLEENEEKQALALLDPISALAGSDNERLSDLLCGMSTTDQVLSRYFGEMGEEADMGTLRTAENERDPPMQGMGRPDLVKLVLACADLHTVETALLMTGETSRGAALVALAQTYLETKVRQPDAGAKGQSAAKRT